MKICWLDEAIVDLQSLREHITLDNPLAANRVAHRIIKAANLLAEHPEMGRPGRVNGTRELIVTGTPYLIPYRVKNNNIQILRIFHGAMLWPGEL